MERCLAVADAVLAQRAAQHVCTKCGYVTATLPVHALRARAEAMTANAEALKARVDLATAQEERDELRPALLPEPGA